MRLISASTAATAVITAVRAAIKPPPASIASIQILNASCSRIGDGVLKVETTGTATAPDPDRTFLLLAGSPFYPDPRNTFNITCGTWNKVVPSGAMCQRSANQPAETTWTITALLYNQKCLPGKYCRSNGEPDETSVYVLPLGSLGLLQSSPSEAARQVLASDSANLACR
jgi:hypothetical protein